MLFHTPEFFILLIFSLIFYYFIPQRRTVIIALANIVFYSVCGLGFLILFLIVTAFNYYVSLLLQVRYRKIILWIAIGVNLANLAFFKYSLLILHDIEKLLPVHILTPDSFWTSIILPIGISFYTFEFISYLVDLYKQKIQPAKSLIDFWVFISFFAHLIAGPIMRGNEFLPQVERIRTIRMEMNNVKLGCFFLIMGLCKKIWFADNISIIADQYFTNSAALTGSEAWLASYLFAFQIYFDFSAYSDMAVGIGYLFGFELPRNFLTPYLSSNATEFWRRWHITLSRWIRDYIYIPLGGSRRGEFRKYVYLFIAMALSGIWHGAMWTFMIWGMYHGLLLIAHKWITLAKEKFGLMWLDKTWVYRLVSILTFFHLTCMGWIFFRIHDLRTAVTVIERMLSTEALGILGEPKMYLFVVFLLFVLHRVEYYLLTHTLRISQFWHQFFPSPLRATAYMLMVSGLIIFMKNEASGFIYFQF